MYGSESALLEQFYNNDRVDFWCIYNSKVPLEAKNKLSFKDISSLESYLLDTDISKKYQNIVFIGAAAEVSHKLFLNETGEKLEQILQTNISNYIYLSKLLLPLMLKIKSGQFIFLSSFSANLKNRGTSLYSASKAFTETFFECIGKEYGKFGVRAVNIQLGCFDGAMFNELDGDKRAAYLSKISMGRIGDSKDIKRIIDDILQNEYLTGVTIRYDGGLNF